MADNTGDTPQARVAFDLYADLTKVLDGEGDADLEKRFALFAECYRAAGGMGVDLAKLK